MDDIKKTVDFINAEEFISEVQKCPAIWDINCEEYCNRYKKQKAWESIIATYFQEFQDKSKEEKVEIANCFLRKWKSFRNSYARELAKRRADSGEGGRKPYIYFDQLRFLDSATKAINEEDSTDEDSTNNTPSAKRSKTRKENEKEPKFAIQGTAGAVLFAQDQDQDKLFMLSLIPEIKKVPEERRLLLKSEILNVILKAQNFYTQSPSQFNFNQSQSYSC